MTPTSTTSTSRRLIDTLCDTELYQTYSAAFQRMTSLPLALLPPSGYGEMVQASTSLDLTGVATTQVPVKVGKNLIAILQTGGVRLEPASRAAFAPMAASLSAAGHDATDIFAAREAFMKTPVMSTEMYEAALSLLKSFACHLGESTHRLIFATSTSEPEPVRAARAFIAKHIDEPMSLESVASEANISPFHFCKIFKRSTGMTFTDYVNHVRVEKARRMLLRPAARITEVAYDVGFQSLSHFNRSFKRIVKESPTEYRLRVKDGRHDLTAA